MVMFIIVSRSHEAREPNLQCQGILVNSHLCAMWVGGYVRANSRPLKRRYLFVVLDCSSPEAECEFYQYLA